MKRITAREALALAALVIRRRFTGRRRRPPCSLREEMLLEVMRRTAAMTVSVPMAEVRAQRRETPLFPWVRRRLEIERTTLGGVPCEVLTPKSLSEGAGEPRRAVLYLHGGGYCLGSAATHRVLTSHLALDAEARVYALDYRLAPEHPHPAALDDAVSAYWGLTGILDPGRLVVAGDSAGGGLTVATLVALRDAGTPLPAGAALLSPWVDLTLSGDSVDTQAASDYLSRPVLEAFARAYRPTGDRRDPAVSPLFGDLHGLPPTLIQAGTAETLTSEAEALAERARDAGVAVELQLTEGAWHVFQAFAPVVPPARPAQRRLAAFIARVTT